MQLRITNYQGSVNVPCNAATKRMNTLQLYVLWTVDIFIFTTKVREQAESQ